jgi:hypothetical protein
MLTTGRAHFWLLTVGDEHKLRLSTLNIEAIPMSSVTADNHAPSDDATPKPATVLVRGETVPDTRARPTAQDSNSQGLKPKEQEKSPPKQVSEDKAKIQSRLPVLEDDDQVGVVKDHVVTRDGKADLAFTGTLIASAAAASPTKGHWQEYRIYDTTGGKHVFSKVNRSVFTEDRDTCEAEIFDPSPSSMPSQLLRSARDLARSKPLTWMDAAVAFFGYDPLAKALYRKVSGQFEEHIT